MKRALARLPLLGLVFLAVLVIILVPATAWAQTSTIDTDVGDIGNALREEYQTKSCYAAGLHWFFWVDMDDDNAKFSSSADLSAGSWAAPTILRDVAYGTRFAIWYDGTHVHIALSDKSDSNIYYRMGTPGTDGTIAWAAGWDMVVVGASSLNIITDSDGYPLIAKGSTVYRSTTNDGTFTSDGSPYTWVVANPGYAELVPLTGGKVAAMVVSTAGAEAGNGFLTRWDGFNWSAEKKLDDTYPLAGPPNGINVDDDVYFVIKRDTAAGVWRVGMVKYTYSSNTFGSMFWVYNYDIGGTGVAVTKDTNDDIYILWPNYYYPEGGGLTDKIYYRVYDVSEDDGANSLSDKVTFIDESVLDGLPAACTDINCDYDSDGFLKVYYPADAARAKVKGESLLSVTTLSAAAITETTARLRGEITMLGMASASTVGFEYQVCDSGSSTTVSESGAFGMGVFNYDIEGLDSDECYEYRAFATDASGTVYGDWVSFLTDQPDYESPDEPTGLLGNGTYIPGMPDLPTSFYLTSDPTWDNLPGMEVVSAFLTEEQTGYPLSFFWYLALAIGITLTSLLLYGVGKHTLIVVMIGSLALAMCCVYEWLGWWIMIPYLIFALAMLTHEKQYSV